MVTFTEEILNGKLHFLCSVRQYWSTDLLLPTSVFNQVMTTNRFQKILQFLHFAVNSNYDATDPGGDKLFKVRDIAEFLVDRFKTVYIPSENIATDEELFFCKGRLSFKNKRALFGIGLLSFCEDPGYLWNSFVSLGKTTINENQH